MNNKVVLKKYLNLIKPKITLWNLTSIIGGFLLASKNKFDPILLISVISSMFMILSSSCIFNNYIDRNIDKKMNRTKNRLCATELASFKTIITFASIIGIIGFTLLIFLTNFLTFFLSFFGFFIYVIIYSKFMKRNSAYSTVVGSISGSIPPVVGYCSVSNRFNLCALVLFIIFIFWQIPHFYSISIIYYKEYESAMIPIFPIKFNINTTKNHILIYVFLFNIASILLTAYGCTKILYFTITTIANVFWLLLSVLGYMSNNLIFWAKRIFFCSILVISITNIMLSINFIYKI